MTIYLLKLHLQKFLSIPITKKCQILSCGTLVAKERYMQIGLLYLPRRSAIHARIREW